MIEMSVLAAEAINGTLTIEFNTAAARDIVYALRNTDRIDRLHAQSKVLTGQVRQAILVREIRRGQFAFLCCLAILGPDLVDSMKWLVKNIINMIS